MNRNSSDDKVEFINELNELSSQVDLMDYVFVLCSLNTIGVIQLRFPYPSNPEDESLFLDDEALMARLMDEQEDTLWSIQEEIDQFCSHKKRLTDIAYCEDTITTITPSGAKRKGRHKKIIIRSDEGCIQWITKFLLEEIKKLEGKYYNITEVYVLPYSLHKLTLTIEKFKHKDNSTSDEFRNSFVRIIKNIIKQIHIYENTVTERKEDEYEKEYRSSMKSFTRFKSIIQFLGLSSTFSYQEFIIGSSLDQFLRYSAFHLSPERAKKLVSDTIIDYECDDFIKTLHLGEDIVSKIKLKEYNNFNLVVLDLFKLADNLLQNQLDKYPKTAKCLNNIINYLENDE